jgi:hypothetical protein
MSSDTLQPFSLIRSLMHPEKFVPPVETCELIETHISWVILAGSYAYKIKKSLDLGFLDFSTLEKRRFYCEEELRLNKRLAPMMYLAVVPITNTVEFPQWAGVGDAIEYAVKMRAFPQQAQLDRVLALGALKAGQIDILARHIANFHNQIEVADMETRYGNPESVLRPIEENFKQIREHTQNLKALDMLSELENWSEGKFQELKSLFAERKIDGFVRECHGDLHLRNIAWMDDGPVVFDCIEFSPDLRWIDVINDVAFLVMDLQDRGQPAMAQRFLNSYLEHTGDYDGMEVLQFYKIYRALVRAKIDAIRSHQVGITPGEQAEAEKDFLEYLSLALSYIRPDRPHLLVTYGLSASGKSTVSRSLLELLGAVRVRSDVERKRLFGLKPEDDGQSALGKGIYSTEATEKTYRKLEELAAKIIDAGYPVIVDAVFLNYEEREHFKELAKNRQIPFIILECTTDEKTLRQRIAERKNDISDADLKVLELQLSEWKPLQEHERVNIVTIDTTAPVDINLLVSQIRKKLPAESP